MNRRVIIAMTISLCGVGGITLAPGCASSTQAGAYATDEGAPRNPQLAQELNGQGVEKMLADPGEAEALFRRALSADLYHGPAHNKLGVLMIESGRLYEAAEEFQWAARLMPGHPDPRINLGLVFERAGLTDDAMAHYRTALEVYPGHLQAIQALTTAELRFGRADSATTDRLKVISLRGSTPWRLWAMERLAVIEVDNPLTN